MIKGIGVDIVKLERIKTNLQRLAKRILSKEEKEIFDSLENEARQAEFLGGRFAFKEALFKAKKEQFNFQEVSLLMKLDGSPYFKEGNDKIKISIAHEEDYVVAFVIIEE